MGFQKRAFYRLVYLHEILYILIKWTDLIWMNTGEFSASLFDQAHQSTCFHVIKLSADSVNRFKWITRLSRATLGLQNKWIFIRNWHSIHSSLKTSTRTLLSWLQQKIHIFCIQDSVEINTRLGIYASLGIYTDIYTAFRGKFHLEQKFPCRNHIN